MKFYAPAPGVLGHYPLTVPRSKKNIHKKKLSVSGLCPLRFEGEGGKPVRKKGFCWQFFIVKKKIVLCVIKKGYDSSTQSYATQALKSL